MTHTATAADLAAHDLADVTFKGEQVYAKSGQWIVKLNLDADRPTAAEAIAHLGLEATLTKTLGQPDLALIKLPRSVSYHQVHQRLHRLRLGAYVEPNVVLVPTGELFPNDDYFPDQWGLHNTGQDNGLVDADIDAPEAWDITTGGTNVVMAVFDDGVDYTHDDLAGNMWTNPGEIPDNGVDDDGNELVDDYYGYDFGNDHGDPLPNDADHGTHVAGIMGAVGNNDTGSNNSGIAGVNWQAKLMAIKIYGSVPLASAVVEALNYIIMMKTRTTNPVNVRVTNHSWVYPGGFDPPLSIRSAIALHQEHDILFVAAAGNFGRNNDATPTFPASYDFDHVISVANTTRTDELFFDSSYGATSVDLSAPGTEILSTVPFDLDTKDGNQDGYTLATGTSQAAPHVAGVAGLAFSLPGMADAPYQLVKGAILSGAHAIGGVGNNSQKPTATNGRLNAFNTLKILQEDPVVIPGTSGDDTIFARVHPTDPLRVQVLLNDVVVFDEIARGFNAVVPSLTLNALGGNDTITLEDSFFFPTTLDGGDGNDTISVLGDGVGAETVVISGEGTADALNVDTDNVGLSRVRLDGAETLSALTIGTGGGVLVSPEGTRVLRVTQTLSIASGGFLDLADNPMLIDYDSSSPLASIQSLITSGYNGGAWTGNGIRSIVAAATGNTGLGYAENDGTSNGTNFTTFFGQSVDTTTVLVRYVYYGDADLSGMVNLVDFNRLAAHFGTSGNVWAQGDFTYDGIVNLNDFNRLAANFGLTAIGPSDDVADEVDWEELIEQLE